MNYLGENSARELIRLTKNEIANNSGGGTIDIDLEGANEGEAYPVVNTLTLEEIMLRLYPIGAIYTSTIETNPKELFGGEWVQIKDRFLLSAGDSYAAGSTGGEATHTLTVNEMPAHQHAIYMGSGAENPAGVWGVYSVQELKNTSSSVTGYSGGSQPHNNMPPYLAVYVWQRTA